MKQYLSIAALSAVLVCGAVAHAADNTDSQSVGVAIKVGLFLPTEADTQNNAGNSWVSAGFDYRLNGFHPSILPRGGYVSLSLDYAGKGDYRTVPLLINYTKGKKLYWSVGAGVAFTDFPQDNGVENDKARFAYSGAIGYNFATNSQVPLFLEVRYQGNDQPRLGGVGVYLGARF